MTMAEQHRITSLHRASSCLCSLSPNMPMDHRDHIVVDTQAVSGREQRNYAVIVVIAMHAPQRNVVLAQHADDIGRREVTQMYDHVHAGEGR